MTYTCVPPCFENSRPDISQACRWRHWTFSLTPASLLAEVTCPTTEAPTEHPRTTPEALETMSDVAKPMLWAELSLMTTWSSKEPMESTLLEDTHKRLDPTNPCLECLCPKPRYLGKVTRTREIFRWTWWRIDPSWEYPTPSLTGWQLPDVASIRSGTTSPLWKERVC